MGDTLNNESGATHSECCWPGCVKPPYESDRVPLCWRHFADVGRLEKAERERLGLRKDRPVSAAWAQHLRDEEAKRLERELNKREAEAQVY